MGKTKKTQLELCVQEGEEKKINLFVFPIQFNIMAVSILKTPVKLHFFFFLNVFVVIKVLLKKQHKGLLRHGREILFMSCICLTNLCLRWDITASEKLGF